MKKIILIIAIAITVVSCSKQKFNDPAPKQTTVHGKGTFVFYNDTKDTYRVELFRQNSGGQLPSFYTILPHQSMVIANSIAGDYIIGIMKSGTNTSQDYGFETTLDADCFFEYHIQ